MHAPKPGALACLLALQAFAQAPLTLAHLRALARPAPAVLKAEARLQEPRTQLQETRNLLREGPTLSASAGPRRAAGAPTTRDHTLEAEFPLFLASGTRTALAASLGEAHPLLVEAARREADLALADAYLDAWLADRTLALRESDLATVSTWVDAARNRVEAGADPAFQLALAEGERLKALQERDEARLSLARTWGALVALAQLPPSPVPLDDPGPIPTLPSGDLSARLRESPQRQALLADLALEERALALKEALARSRWSLRTGYDREGEERIATLGFAVRLPRPGEGAALHRETELRTRAARQESLQALAELDARTEALAALARASVQEPPAPDFPRALEAVALRLREGKERPSEALPIRRQLLEAQLASLRRLRDRHRLAAEIQTLLPEVKP